MSNSYKERKVPSNLETGCIDSARMALLKKLAAVNLFSNNHDISINTPERSAAIQHSHNESQRSNSLFDLLNKELSQFSNHTYNMPRQIKSLFSANDSNFPPYKEFTATVETDIPQVQQEAPKKTLKQSIYEKLLRGKSKSKPKVDTKSKKGEDMIKQATFRPQKGTLKSISKQVFKMSAFKLKNQSNYNNSKIKSTLQTQQTPRNLTKYQQLLKYSNLVQNRQREKQNYDSSNNDLSYMPCGRQIPESDVVKLNLKKSLEMKKRFFDNYCTAAPETQKIGMLDLNFEQRQQHCLRSRSLKIIKNDIDKLKNEMTGCTFRPKLTPYRRQNKIDLLSSERRYSDMRRVSSKPMVHFR